MTIKKSPTKQFFERLRKGPLTFGRLVESLRICDEISQTALAKKIGITRANLCDLEKGRRLVSPERAAQFAKALGYPVALFVSAALQDQVSKAGLKYTVELKAA